MKLLLLLLLLLSSCTVKPQSPAYTALTEEHRAAAREYEARRAEIMSRGLASMVEPLKE